VILANERNHRAPGLLKPALELLKPGCMTPPRLVPTARRPHWKTCDRDPSRLSALTLRRARRSGPRAVATRTEENAQDYLDDIRSSQYDEYEANDDEDGDKADQEPEDDEGDWLVYDESGPAGSGAGAAVLTVSAGAAITLAIAAASPHSGVSSLPAYIFGAVAIISLYILAAPLLRCWPFTAPGSVADLLDERIRASREARERMAYRQAWSDGRGERSGTTGLHDCECPSRAIPGDCRQVHPRGGQC
jgi:hypothetical protein